ncbi:MAG TPA: hypothetical protein VNC22_19450 [Sporichthya sp.]|nr:hypothetical protein [Sporichthya sp.]
MLHCDADLHLSRLETELVARTTGGVDVADIRRALAQALRDLDGSVSRDSLAEMAARLVTARLALGELRIPAAV